MESDDSLLKVSSKSSNERDGLSFTQKRKASLFRESLDALERLIGLPVTIGRWLPLALPLR